MKSLYLILGLISSPPLIASQAASSKVPFYASTTQEEKVSYLALKGNITRFFDRNHIVEDDKEISNYFKYIKETDSPFVISTAVAVLADLDIEHGGFRCVKETKGLKGDDLANVGKELYTRLQKIRSLSEHFKKQLPK